MGDNEDVENVVALSADELVELLESKAKLSEFVTTAMIQAIAVYLVRAKSGAAPIATVTGFIDVLRKLRADLTGSEVSRLPSMMVNIQLGAQPQPQPLPTVSAVEVLSQDAPSVEDAVLEGEAVINEVLGVANE